MIHYMFDWHCHLGEKSEACLLCTSRPDEFESASGWLHHAYGLLDPSGDDISILENALEKDPKALVGEFGPDSRHPVDEALIQDMLILAKEMERPFVLHVVRRHDRMLGMLAGMKGLPPFIVHRFTASYEVALEYMKKGGIISLAPGAERTRDYRKLITMPFLLESDLPSGEEQRRILEGWYRTVAAHCGMKIGKLEEKTDGWGAVFKA